MSDIDLRIDDDLIGSVNRGEMEQFEAVQVQVLRDTQGVAEGVAMLLEQVKDTLSNAGAKKNKKPLRFLPKPH